MIGGSATSTAAKGGHTSDGAPDGRAEVRPGSSAPLVYSFSFPFASGTSTSHAAQRQFGGSVSFRFDERGIHLTFAQPELDVGSAPSLSFVMGGATAGAKAGTRVRLFDLDPTGAASHQADATSEAYDAIPATITKGGADAFQGFYEPGEPWGTVSATWTHTP